MKHPGANRGDGAPYLKASALHRHDPPDETTIDYFKRLSTESEIPYQTLINLYLRECAATGRRLTMEWRTGTKNLV